MDAPGFVNRIRSLYNLDWDQLPFLDKHQWPKFRDDPPGFLIRADDFTAASIFEAVEARQKKEPDLRNLVQRAIPIIEQEREVLFEGHQVGGIVKIEDDTDHAAIDAMNTMDEWLTAARSAVE